ncbi:MAG: guanylate kinase [Parvibaculaceae bacterium]|nr:guanylate kinase [Parvibaculaceae bacterium]
MSTMEMKRRGLMLVLSSPSGAGKTTLSRRLLAKDPEISLSVSVTTRPPRPGERHGEDYHFISQEQFATLRDRNALLEHATVFENSYGTPKEPVEQALASGRDVLFDIDWQGTQQLGENAARDLVTVFILPPSAADLEKRLITRAQDPIEVVRKRMAKAANEISHYFEYDYVLINEDIEKSLADLEAILRAERLRRDRQVGLNEFVKDLSDGL